MMMYHHHTKHSLRASALLTLVLTLKLISFLHTSGSFCTGLHSLSCCPHATSKEHSAAQMKPTEQRTICWANQHIRQQNHWTRFQKCSFSRIIEIRVERNNWKKVETAEGFMVSTDAGVPHCSISGWFWFYKHSHCGSTTIQPRVEADRLQHSSKARRDLSGNSHRQWNHATPSAPVCIYDIH